ncbi:RHS repeat-associated core domain-containing protein [Stenotrophomonas rhizophila]|uniref:RHS repeat-associated core domain-containing protein n=1 Tax=Stenotrophomonas rhizophila TaxID=216778 RepID=UPI001C3EAC83|nr:RHS repeat-associated core domain-containing protein [Stenotrophomonas rhizophila]
MSSFTSVLGYNGVLHEAAGSWQILGNGYRVYNPVLMRFHSPDDMSPFGKGGLNAYGYCQLDPINQVDPSGHWSLNVFANLVGFKFRTPLLTPVFVTTAGSLAAVGLAVASTNDTQRKLAIAGAVILAAGALTTGRHVWMKRKILPTPTMPTPAATPFTASAPPMAPLTPTTPAAPVPVSTPARLGAPTLSSRVAPSSPPPKVAIQRAQPRRRAVVSSDLPPPPPPSPSALRTARDPQLVPLRVRQATIRKGSARWEQVTPIYPV